MKDEYQYLLVIRERDIDKFSILEKQNGLCVNRYILKDNYSKQTFSFFDPTSESYEEIPKEDFLYLEKNGKKYLRERFPEKMI